MLFVFLCKRKRQQTRARRAADDGRGVFVFRVGAPHATVVAHKMKIYIQRLNCSDCLACLRWDVGPLTAAVGCTGMKELLWSLAGWTKGRITSTLYISLNGKRKKICVFHHSPLMVDNDRIDMHKCWWNENFAAGNCVISVSAERFSFYLINE